MRRILALALFRSETNDYGISQTPRPFSLDLSLLIVKDKINMECGFTGNSDVYGIGIRIGYYTQALAVWFANYFHFREARVLRSVNNLFLIALAIVGLIYVSDARKVYAVEAFLLLYIGITIAIVSILDSTRFTSRFMETSNERMVARMLISIMGQIFLVYFWWTGLDLMRPTPCQEVNRQQSKTVSTANDATVGTYACYLVRANLYGWLRTLMRVLSLSGLIWSAVVLSSCDPLKVLHSMLTKKTKVAFTKAAVAQTRNSTLLQEAIAIEPNETMQCFPDQSSGPRVTPRSENAENHHPSAATRTGSKQRRELVHYLHTGDVQSVSFSAVYEAEQYLDSVFSICQMREALLGHKRVFSIWNGCVRFYVPYRKVQHTSELVPLRKCFHTMFMWYGLSKISINLRWRFHIHLAGLNKGPRFVWPRLLYRAYQLSNDNRPPDWKMVAIASDVQLSQIPLKKTTQLWAFRAVKHLFIIGLFITQVELTIVWNHVSGLNSLTSLGQLIPFILGVGGLLKVLWSKWRLVKSGIREDLGSEFPQRTEYEAAMETYLEWKKIHRTQLASGPSEQTQQTGSLPVVVTEPKVTGNALHEDSSSNHNGSFPNQNDVPKSSSKGVAEASRLTKRRATR